MAKKYSISIITTTFNRAKYLKKLIKSLENQTYKNFVWLVANDGSDDNTEKLITETAKKKKFKIFYLKSTLRIGKAKLDNLLIKNINTDLVLWCDSDDYFLKDSLENLVNEFKKIPKAKKRNIIGVLAQNLDTNGVSQTFKDPKLAKDREILKFKELSKNTQGDGTILCLSSIYKDKKFLEVDYVINEGSMLLKIFQNKKFIVTNKVVKIMDRKANLSVSFGNKLRYCRGSVYCIAKIENLKKFKEKKLLDKIMLIVNYWRYAYHGDLKIFESKNLWSITKKNNFPLFLLPLSLMLIAFDILRNKVEKTHLEFEKNLKNYKIIKKIYF